MDICGDDSRAGAGVRWSGTAAGRTSSEHAIAATEVSMITLGVSPIDGGGQLSGHLARTQRRYCVPGRY